jgi:hypothetical protein
MSTTASGNASQKPPKKNCKNLKKVLDNQKQRWYNVDTTKQHKGDTPMKKNITIKNANRTLLMQYLAVKAEKARLDKEEKSLKKQLAELFSELGKAFNGDGEKTAYVYASVQVQGNAQYVVYKETTAKGAIDWQAYAMALGGTEAEAEAYRKADNVRTALDWATAKQTAEIEQ